MKVPVRVDLGSQEVNVEVDSAAIALAILEDPDFHAGTLLPTLNRLATYFKGIPDSKISEFSDAQAKIVMEFLEAQAERYRR